MVTMAHTRIKLSETLRRIGHKPPVRGGNGHGPTKPQLALFTALPSGWRMEFVVNTGPNRIPGAPYCYKIDIANPKEKIAIEIDGFSHNSTKRKAQDKRKSDFLISCGWTLFRFSNQQILSWMSSETPMKEFVCTILAAHNINLLVCKES
jgi:hypothetical protein